MDFPEAGFNAAFDEEGVHTLSPDGSRQHLAWAELRAVLIETNDSGPFGADVWWILVGRDHHLSIPQGAFGEAALFERLQALPGFNNEMVISAMQSVENKLFLCWEEAAAGEKGFDLDNAI